LAVYRRPSRTRNVLAVLVLAALTLVTIDSRANGSGVLNTLRSKTSDVFSPLEAGTHDALRPIGDFLTGSLHYGSVEQENEDLRRQLTQDEAQEATALAELQEAEQVLRGQNLPFVGSVPDVTAQIIDIGSSNYDNTFVIGKGTSSGISVGEPVVAAGGLVGSVVRTSTGTATVDLLTDPNFYVGVSLAGGNTGSAVGAGRTEPMKVTVDSPCAGQSSGSACVALPPPVQKVGDILVTSGLSTEKFPKAIPVGKVSAVSTAPGSTEPDIEITPLVNASQLSYVQVLLWSPPA
jgi:rod shape-determining protein MreC